MEKLDGLLGGGLLPGTLTVVLGATGIGKTQLGLQYAEQGRQDEGRHGLVFDMTTRGDSQNQAAYAQRMFGREMTSADADANVDLEDFWNSESPADYLHIFSRSGRRISRGDVETEQWQRWKEELNRKLARTTAFFYRNFTAGTRRCVIDGVEPVDRAGDSFQMHVFDYVYHQIIRKDADWVARDLFRAHFRSHAAEVQKHHYDADRTGCMLLLTSHEVLLDELLVRPIGEGDVLSNANTIIVMGKIREGRTMRRALAVVKHRGSPCDETITMFDIDDHGLQLLDE